MKNLKEILFCVFFLTVLFLTSCDTNQEKEGISYSPISEILKMHPVEITVAHWIEYEKDIKLRLSTEKDAISAMEEPNNWTVYLETTDATQINTIMGALRIPLDKSFRCGLGNPNVGEKICFEDKNGKVRWTVIYFSISEKLIYLPEGIYGEKTYHSLDDILQPAYLKFESEITEIQDANQRLQKPSD